MKKKIALFVLLVFASFAVWAGCLPGNMELGDFCCVPVGNGTAFSCTADNLNWILTYPS